MYGELRFAATKLADAQSNKPQPAINYKADKYVETMYNKLNQWINNPEKLSSVSIKDYNYYKDIVDNYNPQTLVNDISKIQGPDALDYSQSVFNAFDYLKASQPSRSEQTLLGPKSLEPSDKEKLQWARKAKIIDDPLNVLSKGVTRAEIEALRVAYPKLYETMQQQAIAILAQSTDLSQAKSREIGKLLQIPVANQQKANMLQQNYSSPDAALTPTQQLQMQADYQQPAMTPGSKMQSDIIGTI